MLSNYEHYGLRDYDDYTRIATYMDPDKTTMIGPSPTSLGLLSTETQHYIGSAFLPGHHYRTSQAICNLDETLGSGWTGQYFLNDTAIVTMDKKYQNTVLYNIDSLLVTHAMASRMYCYRMGIVLKMKDNIGVMLLLDNDMTATPFKLS